MKRILLPVLLGMAFAVQVFSQDSVPAPKNLELVRATYTKITLKWQPGDEVTQIASYKILRNDSEIATSTTTQYADSGLQSGTSYIYKVIAVSTGGVSSAASTPLTLSTIKSVTFDNSDKVEQVVDNLHSTDTSSSTALTLINAVKSGLESLLGTTITYTVIDSDTLNAFVTEELEIIKEAAPAMTEAERAAAKTELDNLLNESFGGNSFEHVYIQSKLSQLAEEHWIKGHKTAAEALYEFSLNYLKDQEVIVSNTLSRLAYFKLSTITETSTDSEISTALNAHRETSLRFFDYFQNSTSLQALNSYTMPMFRYFSYFPRFLSYDNYDTAFFNAASQLAQSALALSNDEYNQKRCNRITAWELVNVNVNYKDSAGNPLNGSIKVLNVTANTEYKYVFPSDPFEDERTFSVVNGQVTIPVYKGHIYDVVTSFNVTGGNPLNYQINTFPHEKGKKVTYNNLSQPVITDLPAGTTGAETEFIFDRPTYPYNLSYEPFIDVFTLKWDWVAPANFALKNFKVFRGTTVVATVTSQSAVNLPLESPDGNYSYTVVAYDVNDVASAASRPITIMPGDQTPYADYFAWMESYFGNQAMLSCDNPDGDSSTNYEEFLNGTDPTRAPGPKPYAGQRTYTKLTLKWDPMFTEEEGVSYKIYRNDTEVGTSSTNSFTDSGLTPALAFNYKIRAVKADGTYTDYGPAVSLQTVKPATYEYSDKVQQIVDSFNPINVEDYTGASLVSAVKSGLESLLGTSITFSVIDNDILNNFVEEELAVIKEVTPAMTDAERLAARTDLNDFLNENFGGNSFEHMYIQSKLSQLAEEHWLKGRKDAAVALYEFSLNYLKDLEPIVFNTLSRLAAFKYAEITETSTNEEIIMALNAYRDTYLRFFSFFENSSFHQAQIAYSQPVFRYFHHFPTLLKYDNYNQGVYNTAIQLSEAALALNNESIAQKRHDRVASWELVNLKVSALKPDGTPASGKLVIRNVSERLPYNVFPEDAPVDEREIQLTSSTLNIPVYAGHLYDITAYFDVEGGPALKYTVSAAPHKKGQKAIYDHFNTPELQNLSEGDTNAEIAFITSQPQYPYNLRTEVLPDEFTLFWDWVPPTADYQLKHFKIYRGTTEIGTATQQQMSHIPRELALDSSYAYTVVAVDVNDNVTAHSPSVLVVPQFTAEEQKYFEWKQKYFGDTPVLAHEDQDQDGLTNYQEFLLGSNPTVAPHADPKSTIQNIQPGLMAKYYKGLFYSMPDFEKMESIGGGIVENFLFTNNYSNVLNSGLSDEVGVVLNGYFDTPENGVYHFYLTSDDSCKLYIDGVELIYDKIGYSMESYGKISLSKGVHAIRIEYFERTGAATLQLLWSGPGFIRQPITSSTWTTQEESAVLNEAICWQRDLDSDGLKDVDEVKIGTDFKLADTDGDGLLDGEEVLKYNSNPLNKDTDGDGVTDAEEAKWSNSDLLKADMDLTQIESVLKIKGADFDSAVGIWGKIPDGYARAQSRRGYVKYKAQLSQPYVYRLKLNVREYYPVAWETRIHLYIDDVYIGRKDFTLSNTEAKDLYFYTPWLKRGEHNVKIYWDNYQSCSSLIINELEFQKIGGADVNQNEIADWIEAGLNKVATVNETTSSRTSPVCLEGKAKYTDLMTINGQKTALQGAGNSWFANVDLVQGASTQVDLSFQNGIKNITKNIAWTQTNVIAENGTTLTIRKDDSLLFNAYPNGVSAGTFCISCNGNSYSGNMTSPAAIKFPVAGTFTISAQFTANDNSISQGEITVNVVEYSFGDSSPACWVMRPRSWDIPVLSDNIVLDYSDSVINFEKSTVQLENMERYNIIHEDGSDSYILARLGNNGPVLARQKIRAFNLYSSNMTYVRQVSELEDGTKIYEMLLVASPTMSDIEFKLRIFVSGVLFDDGTIEKTLTAADFNELGEAKVYFIYPPETTTSTCHNLKAYQNGTYIGIRY